MAVAREQLGLAFEVRWAPFFLDPSLPSEPEGKDKLAHYNAKFGAARVAAMMPQMAATFAGEGLPEYAQAGRVGNTFDSHRLLELAAAQPDAPAAQDALVEALFKQYFHLGRALSSRAVLLDAAAEAGLDGAAACLDSDAHGEAVWARVEEAYASRVSGVPHFRMAADGGAVHELSGGQPPAEFLKVFAAMAR